MCRLNVKRILGIRRFDNGKCPRCGSTNYFENRYEDTIVCYNCGYTE